MNKNALSAWRHLRRAFKACLPYVRRREFDILTRRHDALLDALGSGVSHSTAALLTPRKSADLRGVQRLCLFVTYANAPAVKAHVEYHANALMDAGYSVILIANTDLRHDDIEIGPVLLNRVSGFYVRENTGFDFAAWAHLYIKLELERWSLDMLLMTNDSIVGPLRGTSVERVLREAEDRPANVVGLTEYHSPKHHVQSYFLLFKRAALASDEFSRLIQDVRNYPSKDQVIDIYETRLTQRLNSAGVTVQALFPSMCRSPYDSNDTSERWEALISAGFPYLKTSVLDRQVKRRSIQSLLPEPLQTHGREY